MSASRVLLTTLSRRTSTKGNEYLAGWLGRASVVAFRGGDDEQGRPTWQLFLVERQPHDGPPAARQRAPEREATPAGTGGAPASGARPGGAVRRI